MSRAPGNPGKQSIGPSEGQEAILGWVASIKRNIWELEDLHNTD